MFKKTPQKSPELEADIRLETEAVSTETLTRVLNNFILRLRKVRDLDGHHREHFLV
jgi:hypothetical protein